jgi:hypothetical protein
MRMYGDFNNQDGPDTDGTIEHPADWLDTAQDDLAEDDETSLGDGSYLKPWKTTDI